MCGFRIIKSIVTEYNDPGRRSRVDRQKKHGQRCELFREENVMKKSVTNISIIILLILGLTGFSYAGVPLESKLPYKTIIIDGDPSDWDGVPTFMTDEQDDSNCGEGTDIKAVYFAKDNDYLYWRMDTWSETYDPNGTISLVMYDDTSYTNCSKGGVAGRISYPNGSVDVFDGDPICKWNPLINGTDYGRIDQIAEGKIPIELFDDLSITNLWVDFAFGCDYVNRHDFEWFAMNHSIYEDGRDVYRISLVVRDPDWNLIDQDVVSSLELLYDPLGNPVSYPTEDVKFFSGPEYTGTYNSDTGEFSYNLGQTIEQFGPVGEGLANGVYRLTAELELPLEIPYIETTRNMEFNLVANEMPIVSSDSFQVSCDESGNLIWEWDAPVGFNDWTHARASIMVFNQENFLGSIYVRGLPTDLGRIFVPVDIIQAVESWGGDRYELEANIRTNDGLERTYSNIMVLSSLCVETTPIEAIQDLITNIENLELPTGTENSLISKLESAINSLENGQENAAVNKLNAFINQVEAQRGKKISEKDADMLIEYATNLINSI